jgi:LDH2 family malate/lactate/ureidoglycolate dehydrogenase
LHEAQHILAGMMSLDRPVAAGYSASLLEAAGASPGNAQTVARHLVDSDARGVHSHGLLRVPQYVAELERGEIDGQATPTISRRRQACLFVDGRRTFGQVAARCAVDEAAAAAGAFGIGLAAVSRSGHAGRIGAYTEDLARRGCIGLAFCSGPRSGHRVAPFGGVEGRLATNPISYAFATDRDPVVADFSTSTLPEGVARRLRELGETAPHGALQDAQGVPTDDPHVLYGEPPGTILPLGGPAFGHKGYALAVLVEAMTTVLCGEDASDATRFGNNLTIVAIATGDSTVAAATALAAYLRETRPARNDCPVLLPGDPERHALESTNGIVIDREVWSALNALGERFGVACPDPSGR